MAIKILILCLPFAVKNIYVYVEIKVKETIINSHFWVQDASPDLSEDATEDIASAMSCSFSVAKATLEVQMSVRPSVRLS